MGLWNRKIRSFLWWTLALYYTSAPTIGGFSLALATRSCNKNRRQFVTRSAWTLSTLAFLIGRATPHRMAAAQNIPSSSPPIGWGIVGLGDVTERKSGPPFWKCDGAQLVAVMRRTPGKAQAWAQSHVPPSQKCVGYDNLQEFLQDDRLEAVYVATPPGAQLEVCRQVAAAGKTVYVEKPVGRCAAETQAMMDAVTKGAQAYVADNSSQGNRGPPKFYTAYISRAYKRTQALRRLLQEGVIGDRVDSIDYTVIGTGGARGLEDAGLPWRLNAEQAGGGLVMDIGCHILDRIDYLCGPLVEVQGRAQNLNSPQIPVEDHIKLQAKIGPSDWSCIPSDGATVSCEWDFSGRNEQDQHAKDELILRGPKGSVRMVGMSPSLPIEVLDLSGKVVKRLDFETPEHTAQPLIQAITNDLRGVNTAEYLSYGENALRTSKVLDQVLETYYGSREIGYWNRDRRIEDSSKT